MIVRFAEKQDLDRVNELRRQVNDIHVAGKPDVFKPGFSKELQKYLYQFQKDADCRIVVAEQEGEICGFALLRHIKRPENLMKLKQDYLEIDEFGVDEAYRRQGIASEMIAFIRDYAKKNHIHRIELNMWEFNKDALAFYEAVGFATYRRYMELFLDDPGE